MGGLEWAGEAPWWCPNARVAMLRGRRVLALPGGRVPAPNEPLRAPGVLALAGVEERDGEAWWVYPDVHAVSLLAGLSLRGSASLSVLASLEILECVARVFVGVGARGWEHPGPRPADLLVDVRGELLVAGFGGPRSRIAAQHAPGPGRSSSTLVFRLGVLLAELICGEVPGAPGTQEHHPTYLRRVQVRLNAAPGGPAPDGVQVLVLSMLAWEPEARPLLESLPARFEALSVGAQGPDLAMWAVRQVPALLMAVQLEDGDERTEVFHDGAVGDAAGRDFAHLPDDDLTDFGSEPAATEISDIPRPAAVVSVRGAPIPVGVGPPPQAIKRAPKLPEGFLTGNSLHVEVLEPPPQRQLQHRGLWYVGWALAAACLIGVALMLVVFLLCWNPAGPQPAGPSLDEVAGTVTPS